MKACTLNSQNVSCKKTLQSSVRKNSVWADGQCIGCLGQWAKARQDNSNIIEHFFATPCRCSLRDLFLLPLGRGDGEWRMAPISECHFQAVPPSLVLPFPRFEHTIDRPTIALSPLRPLLANGGHVRRDSDDDYKTKWGDRTTGMLGDRRKGSPLVKYRDIVSCCQQCNTIRLVL